MSSHQKRRLLLWGVPAVSLILAALYWQYGNKVVTTDNAYAKADLIALYPEVEALVREVRVVENARVESGQALVVLDTDSIHIELERAKAEVERIREEISAMYSQLRIARSELQLAEERFAFLSRDLARQRELVDRKLSAAIRLDEAEHLSIQARGQVELMRQRIEELTIRLGPAANGKIDEHPTVRSAMAAVRAGELKLQRSVMTAPVAGRVVKLPEIGVMARRSSPLLTLVRDDEIWIEANFKETQLEHLHAKQPVTIRFDSRPNIVIRGHIDTIAPASGAEFALLPPQNASGNWVKVVQRIPVRIAIDEPQPTGSILVGMSAVVEVDLSARSR